VRRDKGFSFLVSPNPAKDVLNIMLKSEYNSKGLINILDISGKLVVSNEIILEEGNNVLNLNLNSYNSGIYFIQITSGSNNYIQKFIKE